MCYNLPMKRLTVFIICILLLASGCAKKEEKASLFAVAPLNGGAKTDEAFSPGPKGAHSDRPKKPLVHAAIYKFS